MKKIAVFASGSGSNAAKIIERFRHHQNIAVALIVSNKPGAGVLTIAAENNIPSLIIEKEKVIKIILKRPNTGQLKKVKLKYCCLPIKLGKYNF